MESDGPRAMPRDTGQVTGRDTATDPLPPFVQGERPTVTLPDFCLVIPTYRQAGVIRSQVSEILQALGRLGIRHEVTVVVDGDDDGTATALADLDPDHLRVVVLYENVGKGNAVRRGLLAAPGRMRGFLDGGGDIPAHCLLQAYEEYQRTGADIVVGSKLHPESVVEYPLLRRIYSWGYRQLTRALFGVAVHDTQVGLKIYSATAVEQVFPHVRARGFAFDIEALALARRLGFRRIVESPVVIRDRYSSTIRMGTVLRMLLETVAVWWRVRRFGPDRDGSYQTRLE